MAAATITGLYIDGVCMPAPEAEGVTVTKNKIWSSNTGRLSTGEMAGTLLCEKVKLEVKWPPLTMEEYSLIEKAVSAAWATVKWTDTTGIQETRTMYFGDVTGTQYSWAAGMQWVTDVSVSMIEK